MQNSKIEIIENGSIFAPDCSCPVRFGVHKIGGYYVFMVPVPDHAVCELLLYKPGCDEPEAVIPLEEQDSLGIVRCVTLRFPKSLKLEYMYRINGEIKPGPYAKAVSETGHCLMDEVKPAKTECLHLPYNEIVMYKAHVRGLTMGTGSGVRHKGTFTGVKEKIPYLKELGVNALLLMPVYEFRKKTNVVPIKKTEHEVMQGIVLPKEATIPINPKDDETLDNYWGYCEGLYFVPKKSYCATADSAKEFADMVDALHNAGIEVHLEIFFAEDCRASFAVSVLRYWKIIYKIDGFHVMGNGSWVNAVLADPLLKKTKLFYEGFSQEMLEHTDMTSWGSKEVRPASFGVVKAQKPYERNLVAYNRSYTEHMRRFLKGDNNCAEGATWFTKRNYTPAPSVNFFADQNGFTMADMVCYDSKHNEANGQNNQDGSGENFSWNCGAEGPTNKKTINALRLKQLKNAFLLLFTSQGIPMIYSGDELMNTQNGNNNAWCQDNELGWVGWKKKKDAQVLQQFVKDVIAFREEHPVLRQKHEITHMDKLGFGLPDLSYHGARAWFPDHTSESHMIGQMYYGKYAPKEKGTDDSIYIACNMDWKEQDFALPSLGGHEKWKIKIDTAKAESFYKEAAELPSQEKGSTGKKITVAPRSVVVLVGK